MGTILLVCTGNVCRSPMAAGLLRHKLAEHGLDARYRVASAGTYALDDAPASAHAVAVMAERGIDISDHVAHTINADDVAEADLILVMSQDHARAILNTWPQYAWKVHRISEMSRKRKDVPDPYLEPIEAYRSTADLLQTYIERGLPRILELG